MKIAALHLNTVCPYKRKFTIHAQKKSDDFVPWKLKLSRTVIARSAVAVLGLGFIDAGYSGDWSRIGVISKDTEHLLKLAAFFVVPLCIFLIFYALKEHDDV